LQVIAHIYAKNKAIAATRRLITKIQLEQLGEPKTRWSMPVNFTEIAIETGDLALMRTMVAKNRGSGQSKKQVDQFGEDQFTQALKDAQLSYALGNRDAYYNFMTAFWMSNNSDETDSFDEFESYEFSLLLDEALDAGDEKTIRDGFALSLAKELRNMGELDTDAKVRGLRQAIYRANRFEQTNIAGVLIVQWGQLALSALNLDQELLSPEASLYDEYKVKMRLLSHLRAAGQQANAKALLQSAARDLHALTNMMGKKNEQESNDASNFFAREKNDIFHSSIKSNDLELACKFFRLNPPPVGTWWTGRYFEIDQLLEHGNFQNMLRIQKHDEAARAIQKLDYQSVKDSKDPWQKTHYLAAFLSKQDF
jgi:hypothetical protein